MKSTGKRIDIEDARKFNHDQLVLKTKIGSSCCTTWYCGHCGLQYYDSLCACLGYSMKCEECGKIICGQESKTFNLNEPVYIVLGHGVFDNRKILNYDTK